MKKARSGKSKRPAPSMRMLADACGVSSMTVSRALRVNEPTATDTQRRIRDMAVSMGYQLNARMGRPRLGPRLDKPETRKHAPVCEIIIGAAIGGGNLYHTQLSGIHGAGRGISQRHNH